MVNYPKSGMWMPQIDHVPDEGFPTWITEHCRTDVASSSGQGSTLVQRAVGGIKALGAAAQWKTHAARARTTDALDEASLRIQG